MVFEGGEWQDCRRERGKRGDLSVRRPATEGLLWVRGSCTEISAVKEMEEGTSQLGAKEIGARCMLGKTERAEEELLEDK